MAVPKKQVAGRTSGALYPRRSASGPTVTLPPGFAGPSTTPKWRLPDYGGVVGQAPTDPVNPTVAATPAAAGPPLPASLGMQTGINNIQKQIDALPGFFNTQRRVNATEGATGLVESGLLDSATTQEQAGEGGNVTYRIIVGPDGRLYRQAYANARDNFNARGLLGSSFMRHQQRDSREALNTQVAQTVRNIDSRQTGITGQQTTQTNDLLGQKAQASADYTDWQRQQPAPPTGPPPIMQTNTATPVTPGGPQPHARPATTPKRGRTLGAGAGRAFDTTIRTPTARSLGPSKPATRIPKATVRRMF